MQFQEHNTSFQISKLLKSNVSIIQSAVHMIQKYMILKSCYEIIQNNW